ncbi:transcription termination factor 3, mitochondrial isoform X2 [Bacillus rossius redtenbacheri]
MVLKVISKNPYWLSFSTDTIDSRLGHFQKNFSLTGNEVRFLATKQPRLITYSMNHIKVNTFVIKEELGFEAKEMKNILLKQPKLWMISQHGLLERFEFVHNEMKIPHEHIAQCPRVLSSRAFRIKQRHLFLHSLGRAQYNPALECYVSLGSLVDGTDAQFCENVAKTSVDTFNIFLKTL